MSVGLSRRQAKRIDEHLRKSAVAEHKKAVRSAIKRKLDTKMEHEHCSNYCIISSKYFF